MALIFRIVWIAILAGATATTGLTVVLYIINRTGWANADMVRAVGGLFTKKEENALKHGIVIHYVAGIVVAGFYLHILSIFGMRDPGVLALTFIGGVMGFVHGFIFSFIMVITAENHPLEKFRQADFHVAVAHIIGHVVYGMLIGLIFGILQMTGVDVSPAFSL